MRKAIVAALILAGCGAKEPSPIVAVPPAPPTSTPVAAPRPPPPSAPMQALVMGGPNAIENAAWVHDGAVAVTSRELWRFRPEEPDVLRRTPLARSLGSSRVIGVVAQLGLVAVALEDGSVDVFRDGQRVRTLPAGRHVVELRFSPDGKTLAVGRTNEVRSAADWHERTFLHDVESGAVKSSVSGGGLVFDPEGKRVAARGGVYEVDGGRELAAWPEGFQVLLDAGVMGDIRTAKGEVMAGDYVARGWSGGSAFYANALGKDVALIDGAGKVTRIAASCAPAKKLGTEADPVHARVISVCTDGVVVTDLAKRTSTPIKVPIAKTVRLASPEVVPLPEGDTFGVKSLDYPIQIFDPVAATTRAASDAEARRIWNFPFEERCSGPAGGRTDIHCDHPAWRADGAFRMRVHWGFKVTSRAGVNVIDWGMVPAAVREAPVTTESIRADEGTVLEWRAGGIDVRTNKRQLRYRLGPARATDAPTFAPTAACGKEPYPLHAEDTFTVYSSYEVKGDRVTSTIVCHCTARGCARSVTAALGSILAATEDGTLLTDSTNSYQTETVLELRAPGKPVVRTKLPGGCLYGAFGPGQHAFVACENDERAEIFELAPADLSIVTRRAAPDGRVSGMLRVGDGVIAVGAELRGRYGALLGPGWFAADADKPMRPTPMVYAWPTFGITQEIDGKVRIAGDESAAAFAIRCFDGARLRPFDDCRSGVLTRP